MPRYHVTLSVEERAFLEALTKKGSHSARKTTLARALLLCDKSPSGPAWKVADVVEALGITSRTIEHLKKRFIEGGIDAALNRKQRKSPSRKPIVDGAVEARLLALACSEAPEGHQRWTVRLLSEKLVELKIVDSISHMTVHNVLKKMKLNLISKNTGKSLQKKMPNL